LKTKKNSLIKNKDFNDKDFMNRYKKCFYILIVFLCFISFINAQDRPFPTIKISKDTFIDQTEVDMGSWLSYYSWVLIHEGFNEAQKILPDSTAIEPELWNYIRSKSSNFISKLGSHTLQPIGYFAKNCDECLHFGERLRKWRGFCPMLDFPVTGLTFEQVTRFCEWRTKVQGDNKFTFRLPSPTEWKVLALNGLSEAEQEKGLRDSINNKKCSYYNFQLVCNCGNENYQGKLNALGMYEPEKNGVFDLFGNVSEMTSVKGIAKGGNFTLHANQCHVDSMQKYVKPEIWLGFRCIAVKNDVNNQSAVIKNVNPDNSKDKYGKFTDPRDGNTYPIIQLGNQTWFAANLAYRPDSGKYWAYNNEDKYVAQYGYLYNWKTAKNVCPTGWHLPDKSEFETLLQSLGYPDKVAYNELRPSGSSGLNIIDCGLRFGINFTLVEGGTAFWSSTETSKRRVWGLSVDSTRSVVSLYGSYGKGSGLPIRCIKD
jgi:uncharacterized protein (TIGR02145 family)